MGNKRHKLIDSEQTPFTKRGLWRNKNQEKADIAYYTNLTDKDKAANILWMKITAETAKFIWRAGKIKPAVRKST